MHDADRLPDEVLQQWLKEDVPHGDLTTRSLALSGRVASLSFRARADMRVALCEEAARLFELCAVQARVAMPSGGDAAAGDVLLEASGPAGGLFKAWKVAQTAMEIGGGIATEAARVLARLRQVGRPCVLACTRKTVPGARGLARRAVEAGGAVMHRLGLSETLLVFPEHALYLDDAAGAVAMLKKTQPEKRVVVEVRDEQEAWLFARAGAEVLQLERFPPAAVAALRAALAAAGLHPLLAPAGGVTAANAADYALAGADFLVSSAPYLAPPTDVQVSFEP